MTTMKRTILFIITLCFSLLAAAQSSTDKPITDNANDPFATYKLYPTTNMWTFLKLNTANGVITQVQYSTKGDDYRFESILNMQPLATGEKAKPGRFTLYPTQNMWTFLLLDQHDGTVYQVQWSQELKDRGIIKIQ